MMKSTKKVIRGNSKKLLCKDHEMGKCNLGSFSCPLSIVPDLKSYKVKVCDAYLRGFCPMGPACFDTHGPTDDAERISGRCSLYRSTGRCYFQDKCPLEAHLSAKKAVPYYPNLSSKLRKELDKKVGD